MFTLRLINGCEQTSSKFLKNTTTVELAPGSYQQSPLNQIRFALFRWINQMPMMADSCAVFCVETLAFASNREWWVLMDSNHRPPPYQDGALTN